MAATITDDRKDDNGRKGRDMIHGLGSTRSFTTKRIEPGNMNPPRTAPVILSSTTTDDWIAEAAADAIRRAMGATYPKTIVVRD